MRLNKPLLQLALNAALEAEQARAAEEAVIPRAWLEEISKLSCPGADGFEGPETFPDCGSCVVCRSRTIVKARS